MGEACHTLGREAVVERNLSNFVGREFDLLVVGGGAFGCCAAWDAASRGLKVALIERDDFCAATSANHLKMVHGGIRYLQHLDFKRVRESIRERAALLRIAPHLVEPVPIVMPTYGRGMDGRAILGAGMALYDLVAWDRNRGNRDPDREIPRGRLLSRSECLEMYPGLDPDGLTGAGLFYDAQFRNPPRLALAFLQSAIEAGAVVANYVEARSFLRDGRRVCGAVAADLSGGGGDEFEVRAKIVLNAAGPWAAGLLDEESGARLERAPSFSRDAGFVVRGRRTGNQALACKVAGTDADAVLSRKGRHVFAAPWRDYTLFGSWHVVHTGPPGEFRVEEEELLSFIDDVNRAYPAFELTLDDISMVYAGLTLFGESRPGDTNLSFGKRSILHDHGADGIDGLITLIGVRATTARGVAARAIDMTLRKLGRPAHESRTAVTRVHGGDFGPFEEFVRSIVEEQAGAFDAETLRALAHNFGSDYGAVLRYAREDDRWAGTLPGTTTLRAEIVHAVREEMALTLADVVLRRTELGTGEEPEPEVLNACAEILAAEHGWDEARTRREVEAVRARYPRQPSGSVS